MIQDSIITSGSGAYWIDERLSLICHPYYLRGYRVSPRQFALYAFLYAHSGEIFSEAALAENVWGVPLYDGVTPDAVRMCIMSLRRSVQDEYIVETVYRYGYTVAGKEAE